jgi:hypothetical protein
MRPVDFFQEPRRRWIAGREPLDVDRQDARLRLTLDRQRTERRQDVATSTCLLSRDAHIEGAAATSSPSRAGTSPESRSEPRCR